MKPKFFIGYRTEAKIVLNIEEKLNQEIVSLRSNLWFDLKMTENAPLIQEWKSQQIFGGGNKNPSIIKELSHISFPNLIELSIHGNEIESIEGFSRIRMPELKRLGLSDNRIISVDDLRKGSWPDLYILYIYKNFIPNLNFSAMNAPKFNWVSIELDKNDPEELPYIGKIAKWQSDNFQRIRISTKNRIDQKKVEGVLRKKCHKINFVFQ